MDGMEIVDIGSGRELPLEPPRHHPTTVPLASVLQLIPVTVRSEGSILSRFAVWKASTTDAHRIILYHKDILMDVGLRIRTLILIENEMELPEILTPRSSAAGSLSSLVAAPPPGVLQSQGVIITSCFFGGPDRCRRLHDFSHARDSRH
jgi:hypothetical protein